jgi:hypothetical protein
LAAHTAAAHLQRRQAAALQTYSCPHTHCACCGCPTGCVSWMSWSLVPCTACGRPAWASMCWTTHARHSASKATSYGTTSLNSQGRCDMSTALDSNEHKPGNQRHVRKQAQHSLCRLQLLKSTARSQAFGMQGCHVTDYFVNTPKHCIMPYACCPPHPGLHLPGSLRAL